MDTAVTVTQQGDLIAVSSPYHPDFPPKARRLSGSFDRASTTWTFPSAAEPHVRGLCREIYGTDGTACDTVTLRVTATEGLYEGRGPITIAGRIVASARGRDSGARTGEGVLLLEGRATSGGSMKNWTTEISVGAVMEIIDVPRAAVPDADETQRLALEVEIVSSVTADKQDALVAELQRLRARMGEIESLLEDKHTSSP